VSPPGRPKGERPSGARAGSPSSAVPREVRDAIADLLAEYALRLDEDRLEEWIDLFDADCSYKVVTRENVEQGLPNVLMWCANKDMLRDRVASYRDVNEYNLHWDRHVVGPPRIRPGTAGDWQVAAGYSLFQTDLEGVSRLFSVGRYQAAVLVGDGVARLREMVAIADTGSIPTLLATPV
jgi:anthranilate 1,2-dioxygenase small subunit